MVAIRTKPGEPEERAFLAPGPNKMAVCTWEDGAVYESDVTTLTLTSRNAAAKVAPGKKKKKKKKTKAAASKVQKKPAAAAADDDSSSSSEEEEDEELEEEGAKEPAGKAGRKQETQGPFISYHEWPAPFNLDEVPSA